MNNGSFRAGRAGAFVYRDARPRFGNRFLDQQRRLWIHGGIHQTRSRTRARHDRLERAVAGRVNAPFSGPDEREKKRLDHQRRFDRGFSAGAFHGHLRGDQSVRALVFRSVVGRKPPAWREGDGALPGGYRNGFFRGRKNSQTAGADRANARSRGRYGPARAGPRQEFGDFRLEQFHDDRKRAPGTAVIGFTGRRNGPAKYIWLYVVETYATVYS